MLITMDYDVTMDYDILILHGNSLANYHVAPHKVVGMPI